MKRSWPRQNRTYHYWHLFVPGIGPRQLYGYRVHGPEAPEIGLRFDPEKVLFDPYGRAVVVPVTFSRVAAILTRDENGCPLSNPPVLWDIEIDPVLAGVKH